MGYQMNNKKTEVIYSLNQKLTTFFGLLLLTFSSWASQINWQFQTDGMLKGKPLIVDNYLYIGSQESVYKLSLSGELQWQKSLSGEIAASLSSDGKNIYVHSSTGVYALSPEGKQHWFFAKEDLGPLVDGRTWGWGNEILPDPWAWYRSAPLVDKDTVYFGNSDGIYALNKNTGEMRWHMPKAPITANPVAFENTVIVASWDNQVYALDKNTGDISWSFEARTPHGPFKHWEGYVGANLTPVITGDKTCFGTRGTWFYCLNSKTGAEIWSSKVATSWIGSPAIAINNNLYYGTSDAKSIIGQSVRSGNQTLFYNTQSLMFAQPQKMSHSQTDYLVAGGLSGQLHLIDIQTGRGKVVASVGQETPEGYEKYFDQEAVPDNLSPYQANEWSINAFIKANNAILNLTVHQQTAYLATASGRLYGVCLKNCKPD